MDRSWLGWTEVEPTGNFIAGSTASIKLTYHVGRFGIDDGGAIRIARRWVSDAESPQCDYPQESGYTSVTTSGNVRLIKLFDARKHIRPWRAALQIDIRDGSLKEGDIIEVNFGDRSFGSPGLRMQTFRETEHIFKVYVDCFGTGRYEEIEDSPVIRIIGGPAERIQVATPSYAVVGEPFDIFVRALDNWGNRSDNYNGRVSFSSTDLKATLPNDFTFKDCHMGARRLEGVSLNSIGLQTILVKDDGNREAISNPIIVHEEWPQYRLYWGDFHGQTKETVGTGDPNEYFTFARDVSGVDFSSWQGNDFQVTKELWSTIKKKVKMYHEPGRFVTFLGYEWSGLTPAGGDHNIYFLGDEGDLHRSNHWLIEDKSDEDTNRYPINKLWETFRGRSDVMAIAHVGGRHANFDFFDQERVPLIEVHSHHGTFEWFLEEAINRGLVVGFVGNSDDHTCRPGLTLTADRFTTQGGYTGIYSYDLTREALWEALWARRCYATTGDRIIVWVDIDGHMMGKKIGGSSPQEIQVRIKGTAPLHEVTIQRGVETIYRHPFAKPKEKKEKLIKIEWSGARVKSRPKRVNWKGGLILDKGRIVSFRKFAFDDPRQDINKVTNQRLEWNSTTGGDPDGVILKLDAPENAEVYFHTIPISFTFKPDEVRYDPMVIEVGGVNQRVKISSIKSGELPRNIDFTYFDKNPKPGMNAYWVRIVQADGAMAWTSPIYFEYNT
jgi:hypothetical protein